MQLQCCASPSSYAPLHAIHMLPHAGGRQLLASCYEQYVYAFLAKGMLRSSAAACRQLWQCLTRADPTPLQASMSCGPRTGLHFIVRHLGSLGQGQALEMAPPRRHPRGTRTCCLVLHVPMRHVSGFALLAGLSTRWRTHSRPGKLSGVAAAVHLLQAHAQHPSFMCKTGADNRPTTAVRP